MNTGIMRVMQICDSLFPIGAFTLSGGLETYVQNGLLTSSDGLEKYLDSYISLLPYNELGAFALAFKSDEKELSKLDEIYSAVKIPSEIRLGSVRVASRFFKAVSKLSGDYPSVSRYEHLVQSGKCSGHRSIAFGLFVRDCKVSASDGAAIYGYSICSAIVTNCVRLVPLSQLDGQRILSEKAADIQKTAEKACGISLNQLGISGCGFELRAMQHEKLYSRQYMS